MVSRFSLVFASLLLLSGLSSRAQDSIPASSPAPASRQVWVDSVMSTLSLEDQIAQLLMVRTYSNRDEEYYRTMDRLVEDHNIGGFCFFQGGPVMQARLTNRYQEKARTPLLIALDAEWGLGMRLDSTFSFPYQMTLGATSHDTLLYRMGAEVAGQLKRIGVHINFAPVVDINNNPRNPVINSRSFGEDRKLVADKARAYMRGMQDNGIIATAKHFPGHGDTDSDSHYTLPVIRHSRERLDSVELSPFRSLIRSGLMGVMVAHLYVPALDSGGNTPTTLSPRVIKDLLQDELGFTGLVITDALDMKGVTGGHAPGEIEVKAFQAGNDILLLPQDVEVAIGAIRKAIEQGEILQEEVRDRCRKVLSWKYEAGLADCAPVATDSLYEAVNGPSNELLARAMYEESMVVLTNQDGIIPLRSFDTLQLASLGLGTGELTPFQAMLSNFTAVEHFNALKTLSEKQAEALIRKLSAFDLVIAGIHNTSIFPGRNFGISDDNLALLHRLADSTRVALVLFASPYSLDLVKDPDKFQALVLAHQDNRISNEVAAQVIMGSIPARGRLPVTTSDFTRGTGAVVSSLGRLKYTIPEEAGIQRRDLRLIDSLALQSIRNKETPGCQILVAKDGMVIYRRSFGYHTYKKGDFVKDDDLYDVASLTKIAATTVGVMRLSDQGMLDVDQRLSWYLPYLKGTNKENIIIREMMAHQARLKAWIPFYLNTLRNGRPDSKYYSTVLDEKHTVKVADNLYISGAYSWVLYDSIVHSGLRKRNDYKYSDLGFYLLKEAIENLTNKPLDSFVADEFFIPLGMQHTCYRPLKEFRHSQIVPTEDDKYFRHQLVHGYVHDPGAAMLGGVSGHAGLFSTAGDLAILMQMLLNGGTYGGRQYLQPATVDEFTRQQFPLNENRRGIGFDKPDPLDWERGPTCEGASPRSYGHTGFTGTYAWADPEHGLIYIFLSNRINPSAGNTKLIRNNTRTKIQQVVYDALPKHEAPEANPDDLGSIPASR